MREESEEEIRGKDSSINANERNLKKRSFLVLESPIDLRMT